MIEKEWRNIVDHEECGKGYPVTEEKRKTTGRIIQTSNRRKGSFQDVRWPGRKAVEYHNFPIFYKPTVCPVKKINADNICYPLNLACYEILTIEIKKTKIKNKDESTVQISKKLYLKFFFIILQ